MTLKIIGAGFGRTGTSSTKRALEQLGLNPCYHMVELMRNQHHLPHWQALYNGMDMNLEDIFGNYQASLDWPACRFWEVTARAYPHAYILLTTRDPQKWHESFMATLYPAMTNPNAPESPLLTLARRIVLEDTFHGRADDADYAISVFSKHLDYVQQTAPKDRLIVYDVVEGWPPLCEILGCDIPLEPFPHSNTREDYLASRTSQNKKHPNPSTESDGHSAKD